VGDAGTAKEVVGLERNAPAYAVDKARFTPIQEKLATEASRDENIVRWPPASHT
jgi:hypothetical protein